MAGVFAGCRANEWVDVLDTALVVVSTRGCWRKVAAADAQWLSTDSRRLLRFANSPAMLPDLLSYRMRQHSKMDAIWMLLQRSNTTQMCHFCGQQADASYHYLCGLPRRPTLLGWREKYA